MNDIDVDEVMSYNERGDMFQCTYFRHRTSKTSDTIKSIKDNKTSSDSSNDRTDNESESESIANVFRWLQSLPLNFTERGLKENTNSYKLQETDQNLYQFDTKIDDKRRKYPESSLKRKSMDEVPLEGKNNMLLENTDKKVEFFESDEIQHGSGKKFYKRKIRTQNKKASIKSSVSKLSTKSGQFDLHSTKTISCQSLISVKNNQKILEIFKNISEKRLKNKQTKIKQRQKIQSKIASNKCLLHILENIINVVDSNDLPDRMKNTLIFKDNNEKKNIKRRICISNNFNKFGESQTKKPIFRNPVIQKTLDNAIKNTLKRYILSNTWNCFKENDINSNDEPPVKKLKRMIPSLAPANSLDP